MSFNFYQLLNKYLTIMYSLAKFKSIDLNPELQFSSVSDNHETCRQFEQLSIGNFPTLEECKEALLKYDEPDNNVFAFLIEGPEHGHGKSEFVYNESPWPGYDEIPETETPDVSPEIMLLFDRNKGLISSYYFDNSNPGGKRNPDEHVFKEGEKAWVKQTIYFGDSSAELLMPVEIVKKLTPEDKMVDFDNPQTLNIEKDALIFRPLMTVKANWGNCPEIPLDQSPRIDFLPHEII